MTPDVYIPTRRQMLQSVSAGFGFLAFAGLSTMEAAKAAAQAAKATGAVGPLAPKAPHFPGKAKRVIFLCMRGGPSHLDTFDYKPELIKHNGEQSPRRGKLLKSPWKFKQHGKSGLYISDLFPNIASHADDLCLLRGMHCDQPNHPEAVTQMHTGTSQFVRPSLGSWTLYGLGTENQSMPGFVAINPPRGSGSAFGSAFLPSVYQGTGISAGGRGSAARSRLNGTNAQDAMPDIKNSDLSKTEQAHQLQMIQALNRLSAEREQNHAGMEGVIQSYELAFKMQDAVPDIMDISNESKKTLDLYGIDEEPTNAFGRQCLLARRMAEAGVRFIEVSHGNWDHHANLTQALPNLCGQTDKPIAGLLADLKSRGMLDDTLVIWAGEFGRTPDAPNGNGRDHNNRGYTTWMAGGGVKGGFSYGSTDDFGYEAVDGKVHIHDWHATILHLMGLDHEKLTYKYAGRDFRLTDVHGQVVKEILT